MKLHILSDLHNEFSVFEPHSASREADVIILAGDIAIGDRGLHWARKHWPNHEIIYVVGNHESYKHDRLEVMYKCSQTSKELGIHFLENNEVIIDGVRFLGTSLWMDFLLFGEDLRDEAMLEGMQRLNDFRLISEGPDRAFAPLDAINLFEKAKTWLNGKLRTKFDGKTVVVTHHLPTIKSCAPQYLQPGNYLSACFASNLDSLVAKSDIWIHGHTHDSFDYEAYGARVICNPRGYSTYSRPVENYEFNPALIVEI